MTTTQATPEIQIDDGQVRVTKWTFPPGSATGWHRHQYDYVVVPLTTGALTIAAAEGETQAQLTLGVAYARKAGVEHDVINRNDFEIAFVETELLDTGDG